MQIPNHRYTRHIDPNAVCSDCTFAATESQLAAEDDRHNLYHIRHKGPPDDYLPPKEPFDDETPFSATHQPPGAVPLDQARAPVRPTGPGPSEYPITVSTNLYLGNWPGRCNSGWSSSEPIAESIGDTARRTLHTETTKGEDPSQVDKDGADNATLERQGRRDYQLPARAHDEGYERGRGVPRLLEGGGGAVKEAAK